MSKLKPRKVIRLNFDKNSIELPFDNEVKDFFSQIEAGTAKEEDIHTAFAYFQIYWPFKTVWVNNKQINYPQLFRSYFVREDRG